MRGDGTGLGAKGTHGPDAPWRKEQTATDADLNIFMSIMRKANWRFAKTYARTLPHWYTLWKDWTNRAEYEWVMRFMEAHGMDERFGGRRFRIIQVDGWKFWCVDPFASAIGINKKPLPGTEAESA